VGDHDDCVRVAAGCYDRVKMATSSTPLKVFRVSEAATLESSIVLFLCHSGEAVQRRRRLVAMDLGILELGTLQGLLKPH
jgi:hypothetical protein